MKKFIEIIKDEFSRFTSDTGVMLIMIAAIIMYSFWYVLPYNKEVIKEIPVGVVNYDDSNFARTFIKNLEVTDVLDLKGNFISVPEAEKEFYKNNIKGFIVIPKDFGKNILRGEQVNISLYADSAYLIVYKTLYSSVLQTAIETGAKIEIGKMMKSGIPKKQAIAIKQPFEFIQIPLYNSIGGYKSYVYPIILIMILHQTLLFGLGMLQGTRNENHEKYTEKPEDIPFTLFARSTMYVFLYLLYGAIAFLIFPTIFNYPMHYNVIPLFGIYILMLYTVAFFAQTLSYCFRTRETVLLIMVASSIVLIFIPGLIWPREAIPTIINLLSFFVPATCGVDGIIKLNQNGAQFINIIYDYLWLIFLCIIYFIWAVHLTKKSDKDF